MTAQNSYVLGLAQVKKQNLCQKIQFFGSGLMRFFSF
jgi:hypothetical protein